MKFCLIIVVIIFLQQCSFDNKSGIWKNEDLINTNENKIFDEFEKLYVLEEAFDKIISIDPKFKYILTEPQKVNLWQDVYFNDQNNSKNFNFKDLNELVFKGKKLTKSKINDHILFEENNIITSDKKGNLIVFSINEKKIVTNFNFYKKKYKKIQKYLDLFVEKNIIYVSDNIGYLYAFDYIKKRVVWAKNYKIPFRGNLKLVGNKLIASNQNNDLYFFDKINGEILRLIPTEETIIKNNFKNNISLNKDTLFFLNTFGSLYSVNTNNFKINWFININESINLNSGNIFDGSQIINENDRIVLSSNNFTYLINSQLGSVIKKLNYSTSVKPLIIDDYLFTITKQGFLIVLDVNSGKIIFSSDLNADIAEFLNIKKYSIQIKSINVLNSSIYIFLKNSYYLKYSLFGELEDIKKLPSKINSEPIFINESILYLDFKNRLSIVN
tara:strand:+ start:6431 stop:7756 length:1326 start_codon:yes stop_codon:yes gene_type:complete